MNQKLKDNIENSRSIWEEVARKHGWYTEPFYINVWHDKDDNIIDSVSHTDMTQDNIMLTEQGEY